MFKNLCQRERELCLLLLYLVATSLNMVFEELSAVIAFSTHPKKKYSVAQKPYFFFFVFRRQP